VTPSLLVQGTVGIGARARGRLPLRSGPLACR
jgi:hypothetical protein